MTTLLISSIAAILSVYIFSSSSAETQNKWQLKALVYLFVGASLMWSVDAIFEIAELGTRYFTDQTIENVIDDSLLGLTIVGFGLFAWFLIFLLHSIKKLKVA